MSLKTLAVGTLCKLCRSEPDVATLGMHLSLAPALLQAVYDDTSTVYLKVPYLWRVFLDETLFVSPSPLNRFGSVRRNGYFCAGRDDESGRVDVSRVVSAAIGSIFPAKDSDGVDPLPIRFTWLHLPSSVPQTLVRAPGCHVNGARCCPRGWFLRYAGMLSTRRTAPTMLSSSPRKGKTAD